MRADLRYLESFTPMSTSESRLLRFENLPVGARARVVRYQTLDTLYRNRLMALGLTPGTEFEVQHLAPLGDPVQIRVRGFHLSLRRHEAGAMEVELL